MFVNGGGDCGPFLLAQARGSLTTVRYGRHGSLNAYLVPNGVAKITVEYTAARSEHGGRLDDPAVDHQCPGDQQRRRLDGLEPKQPREPARDRVARREREDPQDRVSLDREQLLAPRRES